MDSPSGKSLETQATIFRAFPGASAAAKSLDATANFNLSCPCFFAVPSQPHAAVVAYRASALRSVAAASNDKKTSGRLERKLSMLQSHMAPEETAMLREISRHKRRALEFGCGGSTLVLLSEVIERVDSVETDPAWIATVRADPIASAAVGAGRLQIHRVNIGPTKAWGMPLDDSAKALWPRYSRAVWRTLAEPPDLVFIDGRFRVACILTTLLRCRPTIVVHDFWDRLKPYGEILEFLDVVHRVESLGVFSPRPDIERHKPQKTAQGVSARSPLGACNRRRSERHRRDCSAIKHSTSRRLSIYGQWPSVGVRSLPSSLSSACRPRATWECDVRAPSCRNGRDLRPPNDGASVYVGSQVRHSPPSNQ